MPQPDKTEAAGTATALSLSRAVRELARAFREAGIESADLDARRLVSAAAAVTVETILATPETALSDRDRQRLDHFRHRRLASEPVARILGERGFYGRLFRVTPDTLDPRPETETIVEAVLGLGVEFGWSGRPLRILDVGTGTGCLLVSLLAEWPRASGLGTDISAAALAVAEENAQAHGVMARARFRRYRSLEGIDGPFDLLVSNPPYIPSADIAGLEAGVRQFDPRSALDGGADGLSIYRELLDGVWRVVPDGWAVFEVGRGQAGPLADLARASAPPNSLAEIRSRPDLAGVDRCVALRTQS